MSPANQGQGWDWNLCLPRPLPHRVSWRKACCFPRALLRVSTFVTGSDPLITLWNRRGRWYLRHFAGVCGGAKRRDGVWFRPSHSIWALPPPQTPLGPETASPVCPGRSSHSALVPKGPGYSERQRDSVFPSPPLSQPPSPLCLILNPPTFGLRAESLFLPVRLASPLLAGAS